MTDYVCIKLIIKKQETNRLILIKNTANTVLEVKGALAN